MNRGDPRRRLLVGFAESLAAIESVWNLLDHGFEVHAFTRRGSRHGLAREPRVVLHDVTPPEADLASTLADLVRLLDRLHPAAAMPLDDVAVHLLASLAEEDPSLVVAGPVGAAAKVALDKRLQLEHASAAGLAVPPTLVLAAGEDPGRPDFHGPWVVKAALAVEVVDNRVARGLGEVALDEESLARLVSSRTGPVLVQPLIDGVGRGLFGVAHQGRVFSWSGHERIRMMNPAGSGSSACRSVTPAPDLVRASGRMMDELSWDGLFMLEFLLDNEGTSWFMELNGRTWGSIVLATRRGLSYPAWHAELAIDPDVEPPDLAPSAPAVARHIGRELLHLAFVARARRRHRRSPTLRASASSTPAVPTLGRAVRDVVRWNRGDIAYNYRPGRLGVLAQDTVQSLLSAAGRGKRS